MTITTVRLVAMETRLMKALAMHATASVNRRKMAMAAATIDPHRAREWRPLAIMASVTLAMSKRFGTAEIAKGGGGACSDIS